MPQGDEQSQQKRRTRESYHPFLVTPSGKPAAPQTNSHPDDEAFLAEDVPRPNTSVVRYSGPQGTSAQRTTGSPSVNPIPSRRQQSSSRDFPPRQGQPRTTTSQQPREQRAPIRTKKRVHWLLPVGVGMVAMLVLWVLGSAVLAWGAQRYNDIRYGTPRTYQTDVVVGNGDTKAHPSHFIAINLNRQAIVIEFIGGDPAKSVSYVAPFYIGGDGGDLAPVTVDFRNVTGHLDGKLDMIIDIHLSQNQEFVFVNDGTKFRPPTANDRIHL